MKSYRKETEIGFGKHKGKTISEVTQLEPSYLNWCMVNLEHFYISDEVLSEMHEQGLVFSFNAEAEAIRKQKLEKIEAKMEASTEDYDPCRRSWSHEELAEGDWNYSYQNPAHDPDENPWIDVFGPGDEAEAAYWNTD
jgi:hypothetical protein